MDRILLFKFAVGVICAIAMISLLLWRKTYAVNNRSFFIASIGGLLGSRLALYCFVFFVMGEGAQSDVLVYVEWTRQLMAGQPLYSDACPSCYSPPFLYAVMALLWLWDSALSVVLFGIVCDAIAFLIWIAVGRRLFNEHGVRQAVVIYVTSPIMLWGVALGGQNQTWVAVLLAAATWLLVCGRDFLSGAALAISTSCVKFLPLMYAPALGLAARWPGGVIRWSLGFAAVNGLIYGAFWLAGVDVLYVVGRMAGENSSGNLPFMVSLFGIDTSTVGFKRISDVAGIGALGVLCIWLLYRTVRGLTRPVDAVFMIAAIQMLFMLVSKKSHNSYLLMVMFPVALTIVAGGLKPWNLAMLAIYTVVSSIEQSFWFRAMRMADFSVIYGSEKSETTVGTAIAFAGMEIVVLWFYLWSLARSCRKLRESGEQQSLLRQSSPARD